jgi:hypothetical protein
LIIKILLLRRSSHKSKPWTPNRCDVAANVTTFAQPASRN